MLPAGATYTVLFVGLMMLTVGGGLVVIMTKAGLLVAFFRELMLISRVVLVGSCNARLTQLLPAAFCDWI